MANVDSGPITINVKQDKIDRDRHRRDLDMVTAYVILDEAYGFGWPDIVAAAKRLREDNRLS